VKPYHVAIGFFFAGALLIVSLGFIVYGDNGLRDFNTLKQELRNLKAANDLLQQENIDLHRKIQRLKEDPEFMETIARQELKMIKKDELVFKFKEDDADKNQTPMAPEEMKPEDMKKEIPHE